MNKNELKDEFVNKIKGAGTKAVEKAKQLKDVKATRANIHTFFEKLQENGKIYISVVIAACIVMVFFCFVVFLVNVKGPEEVMVPDVRGKELTTALIEMQNKELYPKITLRYSEIPGDEGTILDQSPSAGSIVKGYSRVSLVVSRGVVVDHVEKYIGMNFDDLKMQLQTLFAGSAKPLIVLDTPEYVADLSDAGTILEQDPPEGTELSEPVTVKLVVSRGPNFENTRVPNLMGYTVDEIIGYMEKGKLILDVSSHVASKDEDAGTVTSQQEFEEEFLKNYSRMAVELALPRGEYNDNMYGIFEMTVSEYPYPVPMRLEAQPAEGDPYDVANIVHSGGKVTIPYAVPKGTTLTLYVVEKPAKKLTVH